MNENINNTNATENVNETVQTNTASNNMPPVNNVNYQPPYQQQPYYQQPYQPPAYYPPYYQKPVDQGSFGWSILGFFLPMIGLILYLVWKDEKPISSKQAGTGALIGFIVNIALIFISVLLYLFIIFFIIGISAM